MDRARCKMLQAGRSRNRRHRSPPRPAAPCASHPTPGLHISGPVLTAHAGAPQPGCVSPPVPFALHRLADMRSSSPARNRVTSTAIRLLCRLSHLAPTSNPTTTAPILPQPSQSTLCSSCSSRATTWPATRGSSAAPRWRAPSRSSAPAPGPSRAGSAHSPPADPRPPHAAPVPREAVRSACHDLWQLPEVAIGRAKNEVVLDGESGDPEVVRRYGGSLVP